MVLITRTELIDKVGAHPDPSLYSHPQIGRANARRNVRLPIS